MHKVKAFNLKVLQWLALFPHSKKVLGYMNLCLDGFLPQSKNMQLMWLGLLVIANNCE